MKIEILYISVGLLTGVIITFMILDNFYQEQLNEINIEYRKNMEGMNVAPEIKFIENNVTCPEIECPKTICHYISSFMDIVQSNADHEYILDEYDCTQFSDKLVKELNRKGWEAEKIMGYYYDDGKDGCGDNEINKCMHEWVVLEVPIEAVHGYVIEPDVYDTYYSLNRRG